MASPSCSGNSASQRTIGYFEGWGITRPCGAIFPEDLVSGAYTHLNFAFALIDPNTFQVAPMIDTDRELYSRLTNLKVMNPGLQVWISIGGWSMYVDSVMLIEQHNLNLLIITLNSIGTTLAQPGLPFPTWLVLLLISNDSSLLLYP